MKLTMLLIGINIIGFEQDPFPHIFSKRVLFLTLSAANHLRSFLACLVSAYNGKRTDNKTLMAQNNLFSGRQRMSKIVETLNSAYMEKQPA